MLGLAPAPIASSITPPPSLAADRMAAACSAGRTKKPGGRASWVLPRLTQQLLARQLTAATTLACTISIPACLANLQCNEPTCRKLYLTRPMLSFSAMAWYAASVWCPIRLAYVSRLMFRFHCVAAETGRMGGVGQRPRCEQAAALQNNFRTWSTTAGQHCTSTLPHGAHLKPVDVWMASAHVLGLQVLQLSVDVEAVAEGRHG